LMPGQRLHEPVRTAVLPTAALSQRRLLLFGRLLSVRRRVRLLRRRLPVLRWPGPGQWRSTAAAAPPGRHIPDAGAGGPATGGAAVDVAAGRGVGAAGPADAGGAECTAPLSRTGRAVYYSRTVGP